MRSLALRDLARWQRALDRSEISAPHLLAEKERRMRLSAFAFLRGTLPLYKTMVQQDPGLLAGVGGRGLIIGDAHSANFGMFKTHAPLGGSETIFAVNDFDEACIGDWAVDVIRLVASIFLVCDLWHEDTLKATRRAQATLDGYAEAHAPCPKSVRALLARGAIRTSVLRGRTDPRGAFIHGTRYLELDAKTEAALPQAMVRYVRSLPAELRPDLAHMKIIDAAFRVAGNGSLGRPRIAVSVIGKRKPWLFDFKAERTACFSERKSARPAEAVLHASCTILGARARLAGTTMLGSESMYVRRLTPEENKLDLLQTSATEREPLCRFLGSLLRQAHERGSQTSSRRSATLIRDPRAVIEQAADVAAKTKAVYTLWLQQADSGAGSRPPQNRLTQKRAG
jgi:uncharacterized protein (DUF2252 family)